MVVDESFSDLTGVRITLVDHGLLDQVLTQPLERILRFRIQAVVQGFFQKGGDSHIQVVPEIDLVGCALDTGVDHRRGTDRLRHCRQQQVQGRQAVLAVSLSRSRTHEGHTRTPNQSRVSAGPILQPQAYTSHHSGMLVQHGKRKFDPHAADVAIDRRDSRYGDMLMTQCCMLDGLSEGVTLSSQQVRAWRRQDLHITERLRAALCLPVGVMCHRNSPFQDFAALVSRLNLGDNDGTDLSL